MARRLVQPAIGETEVLDAAALERQAARARRKKVGPKKRYTHEGRQNTRTGPEKNYTTERHGGNLMPLVIAVIVIWVLISVGMWLRAHPISWPTFDGGYHYAEPAPRGHFPPPLSYPHEWKQQP